MNDKLKSLYQQVILAKSKDEKFLGELEGYTHQMLAYNPLCGDKFELQIKVEAGVLKSLKYKGYGCSISKASTAVMCAELEMTNLGDVQLKIKDFLELISSDSIRHPEAITKNEELLAFAPAREFPERKSCADLSWKALHDKINQLFPNQNHSKE